MTNNLKIKKVSIRGFFEKAWKKEKRKKEKKNMNKKKKKKKSKAEKMLPGVEGLL